MLYGWFQDAKKTGHRGFGFVTFFEDGVAEQVAKLSHEILGQPVSCLYSAWLQRQFHGIPLTVS